MEPLGELTFLNVLGVYNALWDLGGTLALNPTIGNRNDWLLTFREGLRGMMARIISLDREYVSLRAYQTSATPDLNPNEWGLMCEAHAGLILFSMDSTVECLVFSLNAIGFVKSPLDFVDITDAKALRQVSPKNIVCSDPTDRRNPRPGYKILFPRVAACWTRHLSLLTAIVELHDVSKHRCAAATGGDKQGLCVKSDPKKPGVYSSSTTYRLETLAKEFQEFLDEILPIALEEGTAAFGLEVFKRKL